jgi:hypothetical protein
MCEEGDPNRLRQGPLVNETGERERIQSRYLNWLHEVAAGNTICKILYIDNMETVTDSRGSQKGNPLSDLACLGLRA